MASSKNFTEVLIGGKVFTLSGFESEDYLLALNIADDYFKAKKQGTSLENDIEEKDKDMYELKHDLISVQIKLENAEKAMDKLKEENKELQLKIVQLETENKNK